LDNVDIGQSITIGCVLRTCGGPNIVTFTGGSPSAVQKHITRAGDGAFNWNPTPTCDNDIAGTYTCTAENQLGSVSRTFRITGKYNCNIYLMNKSFLYTSCYRYTSKL